MTKEIGEWAKGPRRKLKQCATCALPGMIEKIRQFLEMKISGESQKTVSELHSYLEREHAYSLSPAALGKHIRRCEEALWRQTIRT